MNWLNLASSRGNFRRAIDLSILTLAWGILSWGPPAQAAPTFTDPGFVSETIATLPQFTPVGLAFAPDGRMFVWQKSGVVRIVENGVLLPTPFIDIQSQVNQFEDRGLLGLALDPNMSTSGYVYLLYTRETGGNPNDSGPKTSRLTRVTADPTNPNRALAGSEVVILDDLPSEDTSHSIGTVRFAPDGNLFVSVGDGASFNFVDDKALRALDLNSVNGKILRVTTSGAALPDNPFYDGTNSVRSKVWSYGLRNPFRFGLHPITGEPTLGDVGWNDWEELNRGRGANFGWPCYEGNGPHPLYQAAYAQCQALSPSVLTPPLFTYPHTGGNAVVAGAYYSATQYPTAYRGNFFFGDYVPDWIHRAVFDFNDNLVSIQPFADNLGGPVAIELGPDGLLYYVAIISGEIGRIRFNGPLAKASATPTFGYSPLGVDFSSAGSIDPSGGQLTYSWTFGDGGTSTLANPSHTYASSGVTTFTATLTVRDSGDQTSTDQVVITVGSQPPTATITTPADGTSVPVGSTVTFQGTATDPDDGALPPNGLSWTILLHHDSHVHPLQTASGTSGSFVVVNHGVGIFGYEVILTAADSSGLTNTKQILLPVVPAPLIGVNPATINLTGKPGGSPVSLVVTVTNDGSSGTTLNWTAIPDQPWLTVSPSSETAPSTFTVSAYPASLLPGTYTGSVTLTAPDASNSPVVVPVTFAVVERLDFTHPDRTALIADGWDFVARTAAGGSRDTEQVGALAISYDQTSHPGTIRIPLGSGEIWQGVNDSQNTLFRDLPSDWTSVRLKIAAFNPSADAQQVGLLAYENDDTYVNLNRVYINGGQIELFYEQGQATTYANRQALSNSGNLVLRLDRDATTDTYTGYYSTNDGATWVTVGSTIATLASPRLGIQVGANLGAAVTADLEWVEIKGPGVPEPLTVTSVSPSTGNPGQSLSVVLTGTEFVNGATCEFGADITVTACIFGSATQLTASVSIAGAATVGSRTVTVTNPGGESATLSSGFTVVAASGGAGHWDFVYPSRNVLLADGWDFVARTASGGNRDTEQTGILAISYDQTAHPGTIRIPVGAGEIWQDANNSQNTLFRDLPSDWSSVRLKIATFNPLANNEQVGLLVYENDDTYVNLNRGYIDGAKIELFREQGQGTVLADRQALNNSGNLVLRLDRDASTNTYTGYYSANDGTTWVTLGSTTMALNSPRLAIQVGANAAGTTPVADLAWVEIVGSGGAPAPTVGSVSPASGRQGQTMNVVLTGTGLVSGATCSFGADIVVTACTAGSATQLTASVSIVAGATVGSRTVTVTNPDGQSADLVDGFTVTLFVPGVPTVTSVSPSTGNPGQGLILVLTGTEFVSGATCSFGADVTVTACTVESATQLTASVSIAAGATVGSRTVTVTNPNGESAALASGFTVVAASGGAGHWDFVYAGRTALLADGWDFVARTTAGGSRNTEQTGALAISYDQTSHPGTIRIPVGAGEIWQDANNSQNTLFRDLPSDWSSVRLKIAAFNPAADAQQVGLLAYENDDTYVNLNRVYLNGGQIEVFQEQGQGTTYANRQALSNSGNLVLRLDRNAASNTYTGYYSTNDGATWVLVGSTTALLNSPRLAIQVGANAAGTTPVADLAWAEIGVGPVAGPSDPPTLIGVSPASGSQGQSLNVVLAGTDFVSGATCSFGPDITVTACTVGSGTQLTASVSIGAGAPVGTRTVTVTNPDGQSADLIDGFSVTLFVPAPTVTGASPSTGNPGQSLNVTLAGTNFVSGATCSFGPDIAVTMCAVGSATQLTASVSIGAGAPVGTRTVTVTNPDGRSGSLASGFSVVAAPGGSGHFDLVYPDRAILVANAWDFLARTANGANRDTEQTGALAISYDQTGHPGTIRIPLGSGEIWQGLNNSQNTLFRDMPSDWTSVRLKIAAFNPAANFQQVGLLAYQDDDNYVNLNRAYIDGGQIELFREQAQVTTRISRGALSNSGNLVLRLDRDAAVNTYTGYYSTDDGATWVTVGNMTAILASPRLGIQVGANLAGTTPVADLAWVEIVRPVPVSPGTLSFAAIQNGTGPAPQALSVTDSGEGTMTWTASASQPWINLSPASGAGSSVITVAVSSSGLVAGTYSGAITVTPSGALHSPKTIAVALTVTAPPTLSLNSTGLAFTGVQSGAAPTGQTLTVANVGGGTMTWSASITEPWLSLSQNSGTAISSVAVNASTVGLSAGTYNATITVTAPGAASSPQAVGVTLIVDPPEPALQASPVSLSFGAVEGGASPGPQAVAVTNVAPGSMSWSAVGSQPWIMVTPLSGNTPDSFVVSVSSNGLVRGSYSGAVTLTSAGAVNSPLTVPVTLTVISSQPGRMSLGYASRSALLADGWDFFARAASGAPRNTEQTAGLVVDYDQGTHPGTLRIPADQGTPWSSNNNTRNALFRDLPADWQSIRLKVASFAPTGVYQSACLAAYQNDDNYVVLCRDFVNAQLVEWWQETAAAPSVLGSLSNTATANIVLRLDRNLTTNSITAFVSTDGGGVWTQLPGSVVKSLAAPRLGIMVGGNASGSVPYANLEFVEVVSPATLGANPSNFVFGGATSSSDPGSQILTITNTGAGELTWSASSDQPWLTVTPTTGNAPGIVTVKVSSQGLSSGVYNAAITLTSPQAANSPRIIPVTLTLALPALMVSPTGLGFSAELGGGDPGPQVLAMSNSAGSPLAWAATVDQPWLDVSSSSGTTPALVTVSVSSAGLAGGTHYVTITFTSPEATNSPLAVPVSVVVSPPAETAIIDLGYGSRSALLADGWDFFARAGSGAPRDTEQTTGLVVDYNQGTHPGTLRVPADQGTAWSSNNNTRNALFRDLPDNWQSIRLKVAAFAPTGVYQSACLAAYQNDDNYVTLCRDFVGTQLVEWWQETSGTPSILGNLSSTATANMVLRLDRNPTTNLITALVSTDGGGTWTQLPGSVVKSLAAPRLGIMVGGNAAAAVPSADLDWVETVAVPPIPAPPTLGLSPGSLAFSTMAGSGNPLPQSLTVGGSGFTWSASVDQPWLSISPASGPSSSSLVVSVSTDGLAAGSYSGAVTFASAGASNSPQIVPVTLTVGALLDRRVITAAVLVNGANQSGYNPSPVTPGEFQRYPERYLEHLQVPYEIIDVSVTLPPTDLFDRQIIVAGHRGLDLSPTWQDAITNAVARGTGFLNLDWDPAIGAQSHIRTVFGATGARAGTPGEAITVPAGVIPGGSAPHYIAALQKRFLGDPTGDITYVFHPDGQGVQQSVQSTVLTGSAGAVIARIGDDPLIVTTAYSQGRAVHVGSLEYLKADRFGFLQGVDDLFWRSLVWAARKPFIVRGYPKLWAVQMDDTEPGWGSRVGDMFDPALTGPRKPDGTGGPWKVTGYVYNFNLPPGSAERSSVAADIGAGRLEVSPHSSFGAAFGDLYWNGTFGPLTDAQWQNNVNDTLAWAQGLGGSDTLPLSRSMVPHYWDLSNNTGRDMWNLFGFRYATTIQRPGFQQLTDYGGQERFNARPFWIYEKPPKRTPYEDYAFFFADDLTVESQSGVPPQTFFHFTSQVQGIGAPRWDVTWPAEQTSPFGTPWSVQQSVNQFELYTWRLWSSLAPVQIFTHDSTNYELSTVADRQDTIRSVSSWLNSEGVRHRFMDDFGDYVYARTKSSLSRSEFTGGNITHMFTGNSATADGALIDTELQLYLGDDEGTAVAIPGFSGGRLITLPVGGP